MIDSLKRTKLVGEFIRKKREAKGLSQRALGLLFTPAVTTQFISNVERGVTPLPPTHIPVLSRALAITEGELMMLLEKEYAFKLSGRLGKMEDGSLDHHIIPPGSFVVSTVDYEFMKSLYDAYSGADSKTRQTFASICENVLKLHKVPGSSDSTGDSSGNSTGSASS